MSDATQNGPMLAADGTPLKRSLARSLRNQKLRALALISPLLIFVLLSFIFPIASMLFRSVENEIVGNVLPQSKVQLEAWDGQSDVPAPLYRAMYYDMFAAAEAKRHTRLGTRLNYEVSGMSSLFRQSGRKLDKPGKDLLKDFKKLDAAWAKGGTIYALMAGDPADARDTALAATKRAEISAMVGETIPASFDFAPSARVSAMLPATADAFMAYAAFEGGIDSKNLAKGKPWETVFVALAEDLQTADAKGYNGPHADLLAQAIAAKDSIAAPDYGAIFAKIDKDWAKASTWQTIKTHSPTFTNGYFLNAIDMRRTAEGAAWQPEDKQILLTLFGRTLIMSLIITGSCILLGYPVAYILANLPMRTSNLLMILVLLPFWTSLLVRTSAWKVMLQQQGVINDVLVWLGLVADEARLVMINNELGTIIAMTHILLPFMILPMYSVMQTIPPSYVRAAKSLGATNWTTFWRVYFPQSVPGIGAGSILVFILAIGYYITPEIVGGTKGVFISNRIAYHISSSLNWGLAAALGTILLAVVLILYWAYDKIVGIDNVKLG